MGNNDSKKSGTNSSNRNVVELYRQICDKKSYMTRSDLQREWGKQIHPHLYKLIEAYIFQNSNEIDCNGFGSFYKEVCMGDVDQKIDGICKLLGSEIILGESLLQLIKSVIESILLIEESKKIKNFKSWSSRCSPPTSKSLSLLAASFLHKIDKDEAASYTNQDLRALLQQFDVFFNPLLSHLYKSEDDSFFVHLYPKWQYGVIDTGRKLEGFSVLNLAHILFINSELPVDYQMEWRLLFSTQIDGESFSRFSGQIVNKGPTVIVLQDKGGHVFGGFAPHNWAFGPNFTGDTSCFLFSLYPSMKIFPATVFNDHYQYLNIGQQTLPNGLGFGGQLEYFGLWLDSEFGKGYSSESCSTFRGFKMVSSEKEFAIASAEVWGVGQPPPSASELGERSILDTNLDAKAILEMAGKTRYSEGLRETQED